MPNIREKIGSLFLIGFPGENPTDTFLNFIKEEKIGGVILFKENCRTHQTTRDNIDLLKRAGSDNLFIAVDQEGGRVSRILKAPAEISSAWDYGTKLGLEKYGEDYERCLLFLETLGVNMNLAPVGDIFLNSNNKCLEGRCFGDSPEKVIPFVEKTIKLARQCGLISCIKHFPGLGESDIDPHELTAKADYDRIVWEQREKTVFAAAIKSGVDMVMTTHVSLDKIDDTIATGSQLIVQSMLRDGLGFDGLVVTDDLNMKGASSLGDIGQRTIAAFNAGHDLLLFGQDIDSAMQAFDYFCDAYSRGEITKERISSSLERIAGLKFKLGKSVML